MQNELQQGISVVVPCFNGARTLDEFVRRVGEVLSRSGERFELVLVDDGSTDESWKAIRRQSAEHDWVRGFSLMRNYGQHNALLCGIRAARYAVTVTLDDDLQHPPEEIPRLLQRLTPDTDVVYALPVQVRHPWSHVLASNVLKLSIATTLGIRTARIVSPFRVFRTRLRSAFRESRSPWVIIDVYLTWATDRFASIRVRHEERPVGRTAYTPWRRFNQAWDMVAGFSTFPLRVASWIGFAFTRCSVSAS